MANISEGVRELREALVLAQRQLLQNDAGGALEVIDNALAATLEAPVAAPYSSGDSDPCFTCEGENGGPAIHTVRICDTCFGEEVLPAAAPAEGEKREPYHPESIVNKSWALLEPKAGVNRLEALGSLYAIADEAYLAGRAAPAPESQRPEPWNPEIESFDVALQRQHDYNAKLARRVSEGRVEREAMNGKGESKQ